MNRQDLINQLQSYQSFNEQEEADRQVMLELLQTSDNIFYRTNLLAHFTASAWVVNKAHTHVLMAFHNIYQTYAWLGGHADGEEDLLSVALREVKEESGIQTVKPITEGIYSLETIEVNGHEKKGKYVPSHLHLNVTYLLEADDTESLHIKQDENSAVSWFPIDQVLDVVDEPWMVERIYKKLNQKLKEGNYEG
ncbi:MAG: NUDIX hydrolase [Solobacterium sp.]|jgi:hydrolase, NUDIX family|nr:NUDIX hydrolase [Solobacterium sp.]